MPNEKRIALVIGNAEYEYATALQNPVDDALKMAEALERLNFKVKHASNCTISDFQRELRNFSQRFDGIDTALFYYSGHALQYGGDNYLIPVDARLEAPEDLDRLAFQVNPRLAIMRSKVAVSLVFLDACRDDPFKLEQRGEAAGTKRVVVRQIGLREIPETELKDVLIAFAAEQGHTAADGEEGGLSPFTKALLEHLETPGLEVTEMMRMVKKSVRDATKGAQIPWSNDSLTNKFFFKPVAAEAESPEPTTPAALKPGSTSVVGETASSGAKEVSTQGGVIAVPPKPAVAGTFWKRVRSVAAFNLAAKLESVASAAGPLILGFLSLTIAFVLMLISQTLDLALTKDPTNGKQIGFIAAPNWSLVYAVLFPLYLCLFTVLIERCRITLTSLLQQGVIVGARANTITESMLFAAWNRTLQNVSVMLWILLVVIVLQTSDEWIRTCLMPYFGGKAAAIDWSTVASINGDESQKIKSIIFSGIAYLYMAAALFVYLAILIYAAAFCYFLNTLADPAGEFRLVLRDVTVGKRFSDIGMIIYWCSILGLGAGFMMRLQAIYLEKDYSVVTDLAFSDVLSWIGRLPTVGRERIADAFTVPSSWTGLVEMMFTVLILFAVFLFLYNTFEKAKQYYLDNIGNKEWREMMRIEHGKKEISAIRRQSFLATVFPMYIHLGVIVTGMVLSGIFIGYGSIVLATLIYAIVVFVVLPGLRNANAEHEPEESEEDQTPAKPP
jgi:uncharacterized caspase-like protein